MKKSHSAQIIANNISNKDHEYYLIQDGDNIAGYLAVELISNTVIISKLYILKPFRGKGIGAMTMYFVNSIANKNKALKIELTVHTQNKRSINCYLKHGFKITDSLFHKFDNGHSLNGYLMTKIINS